MTGLHIAHADVVAISNRLYQRHQRAWILLLAAAQREGITLLALIYRRIRDRRDEGAREAFATGQDVGSVYWEMRLAILSPAPVLGCRGQVGAGIAVATGVDLDAVREGA